MAYAPNYYNYQVAVIFAIVIVAALILAAIIGAIYFICVVNMRKQKGISRAPSVMSRGGRYGGSVWPPQAIAIEQQPQINYGLNAALQQQPHSITNNYEYQKSQPSPYSTATAAAMAYNQAQQQQQNQTYAPQQQLSYSQMGPLHPDTRIRDIHPEYAYQQGPTMTWSHSLPAAMAQEHGGGSFATLQQDNPAIQGYHMSSV